MPGRVPPVPVKEFRSFVGVVRRLRRDCPWDRKQTHRSLRDSLIEETYEVVETLDKNNMAGLRQELGDLLLHIVMHATIAEQSGRFTLAEVFNDVQAKLIRRHPHVFGQARVTKAGEVVSQWERLKLAEGRASVLDGVPRALPALQRARRVQQRASRVGFDWKRRHQVWEKVREEMMEFRNVVRRGTTRRREEEFGDLLFALVNYARFTGVHPEHALRASTNKFIRRFRTMERELRRRGKDIQKTDLAEMDALWDRIKKNRAPRRRGPL
jgi:MazG family protein